MKGNGWYNRMSQLKTIRLDGDNEQTRKEFEAYLKELGIDLEDDKKHEECQYHEDITAHSNDGDNE